LEEKCLYSIKESHFLALRTSLEEAREAWTRAVTANTIATNLTMMMMYISAFCHHILLSWKSVAKFGGNKQKRQVSPFL
jgi:hypothetical protein